MRTLGVDLAAQDADTAYCAIQWVSEMALPELPVAPASDDQLLDGMQAADWVAIDAPFGWPDEFVAAVHHYAHLGEWPKPGKAKRMSHRETDRVVHQVCSMWPLSVSSDRIAACAWRCANLLTLHGERTGETLDRIGVPLHDDLEGPPAPRGSLIAPRGVVEVYPAAALALWGLPSRGYKSRRADGKAKSRALREEIVSELSRVGESWLVLSDDVRDACVDSDHSLDALICALVACAAATARTLPPDITQRGAAAREGWIHLPDADAILDLAPGEPLGG